MAIGRQDTIRDLIRCELFSVLHKLLPVIEYVLKAVSQFKGEIPTALTPPDIANAEHLWITQAQIEGASPAEGLQDTEEPTELVP